MDTEKIIETSFRGTITLRRDVVCHCPIDGTPDIYSLKLELQPDYETVELGYWGRFLDGLSSKEYTQEELTEHIYDALLSWFDPDSVTFTLTLTGDHYGTETTTERTHP